MRILFVHQNFPGQFKHLAPALARSGATVKAITRRQDGQAEHVDIVSYQAKKGSTPNVHHLSRDFEAKTIRGEACAKAAQALRDAGFVPDVIYAHPGWGDALFLKDVFPDSKLVGYFEFFYRASGLDLGFDPEFPISEEDAWRVRMKNATNLLTLDACDAGISPTQWQKSTYPKRWHSDIEVIHEGIDTDHVRADPATWVQLGSEKFTRDDEIITYVARNLEPYRGFHVFMRALPEILARRPKARVLIVGGSAVSYGKPSPCGRTWKDALMSELGDCLDRERVFFLDAVPYASFLRVLQVSSVHIYLTYPFVLSWSLLEAMAAECAVVASRGGPVEEVINNGENGLLVDFFDRDALVASVCSALDNRNIRRQWGEAARKTIVNRFDLARACLPKQIDFITKIVS